MSDLNYTLGLDLGPNSIGWAIVTGTSENECDSRLLDVGVRVFPEGVDKFGTSKEVSRSEARRKARGMRRQLQRRKRARRNLAIALIDAGLWPTDTAQQTELKQTNPYELRTKALDYPLKPYELGRVFLHLNQRRGFLSNCKDEAKAAEKRNKKQKAKELDPDDDASERIKTEDMLAEISRLAESIKASGARTLGEYLFWKSAEFQNPDRTDNASRKKVAQKHASREIDDHIRGRHTRRAMLEKEFDQIWQSQAAHHTATLTRVMKYGKSEQSQAYPCRPRRGIEGESLLETFGIHGLTFFQRSLKPVPKEVVGLCELEPKQRRCHRSDRRAQRFRLLQEINNLQYDDPVRKDFVSLNEGQHAMLMKFMATREKATFDELRTKLGFLATVKFNLERGKRASIKGMEVDWLIAKTIGKQWHDLPDATKNGVVVALLNNLLDRETHAILTESFHLEPEQADKLLGLELPAGYVKLSLTAIERLLPHLERGLVFEHAEPSRSARAAAGYDEPWALQRRLFDQLPDPQRTARTDCPIGDIPNPVVKRALVELRKVVNAIIRKYGRPREVHVEMGRDLKTRPKDKTSPAYWRYKQEEDERAEREKQRTQAKAKLRESEIPFGAGGSNILKYLLWQEQGTICPYSGNEICFTKLFTSEIEIDHILPQSKSLDDSQMNKVVCFRDENHGSKGKGQKTPREWLELAQPAKYDAVCQRARTLPYPKYKRFLQASVDIENFIARQLNDTRYIAKATVEYLHLLVEKNHDVIGLKGQLTSTLRHLWGLDTILGDMPDSPAWHEAAQLRPGQKNRADHRHHAIDAVVIALTDRRTLKELSASFEVISQQDADTADDLYRNVYRGSGIAEPWPHLRDTVKEAIARLDGNSHNLSYRRGVSQRADRKVGGELHDAMPFGPTENPNEFVKRKPIAQLSANEIDKIRDGGIKALVKKRLSAAGIEFGRGKKPDKKKLEAVLSHITMDSRVPVRKVRLIVPEKTIRPIRVGKADVTYVRPGSTHHLCIFEWQEKGELKWDSVFVTQLEATDRIKRQQQTLADLVATWRTKQLPDDEIRRRKRRAMRDIAQDIPLVQRDASKLRDEAQTRIPANARFVMSLSKGEALLLEIEGRDRLYVYNTAASTTRQMTFYPHTAAKHEGKLYGELTKYPNSLLELNPRKVTVDYLGEIRWAND